MCWIGLAYSQILMLTLSPSLRRSQIKIVAYLQFIHSYNSLGWHTNDLLKQIKRLYFKTIWIMQNSKEIGMRSPLAYLPLVRTNS